MKQEIDDAIRNYQRALEINPNKSECIIYNK